MRIYRFVAAISALLLVSACTSHSDVMRWGHGNPTSHLGDQLGEWPTGFAGQNAAGLAVLKPPGMEQPQQQQWNQIDNYQAPVTATPMPAPAAAAAEGVDYNSSVTVYPVDGAAPAAPQYAQAQQGMSAMPDDASSQGSDVYPVDGNYGTLEKQVFFAHGSARIGKKDRHDIVAVAKKAKGKKKDVSVTVVGHASTRVNTTDDPVRKKEINFHVAQERANAVTNVLTGAGVAPAWVMAVSKGDEEPNPDPGKRGQEAADRRVEIYMGDK